MLSRRVRDTLSVIPTSLRIALANQPDGRILERRVHLRSHPRQHLLAFDPSPDAPARDSFVLFVHGGGWNMGEPSLFRFVGHFFAALGYPTLLAGYRLTPEHRFPAQMHDVFDCLAWGLRSGWKGGAGRRVIAMGHSAGAELAALLVYNQAELRRRGLDQSAFSGFVSLSGPLDFSACKQMARDRIVLDYLGDLSCWELADPLHYVDGSERVPVLCVHGEQDPLVEVESAISFARRVNCQLNGLARVEVLPGVYHADMLNIFLCDLPARRLLEGWLEERAVKSASPVGLEFAGASSR